MKCVSREHLSKNRWALCAAIAAAAILFCIGILIGHYGISNSSSDCEEPYSPVLTGDQVRQRMFDEISADNIRAHLRRTTNASHPAGSAANNAVAQYIKKSLQEYLGADNVKEAVYDVLLSQANSVDPNTVSINNADGSKFLDLQNREFPGDFDGAYFAYAPNGTVTAGVLIYANQASEEDFELLLKNGLPVNGSIILARYGGFRGEKLETSSKYGAQAVLLFLDPSLVAPHGTNESLLYPNGKWMPPTAIERGSVFLGNGDPLSQGFVSGIHGTNSKYRSPLKDAELPKIPAIPIGYGDAQKLFNIMDSTVPLPMSWKPSPYLNYTMGGNLLQDRIVTVTVTNTLGKSPISNIIATIPGCVEPDRYVLLGNHFDAWTMGGIDPNSGTAAMLELARVMGVLKKRDSWCPRRTIVFAAWDAEEYGLIGSTEWVEENLQILQKRAVAYINIDSAVRGQVSFSAVAMPLLTGVIHAATKLVLDPTEVPTGSPRQTLYDVWRNSSKPKIGRLASGSDYANFVNMVGVTSADIRYEGEVPNPAYHTAFETFEYVEKFVDPTFLYHVAMTQVWGEIVRDLADSTLIPFSVVSLAEEMNSSWHGVREELNNTPGFNPTNELELDAFSSAVSLFGKSAKTLIDDLSKFQTDGRLKNPLTVREMNDRLMNIERMFIDPNGLPGRPLERHVLQAPSKTNSYGSTSFAGIMDCVSYMLEAQKKGDLQKEQYWLNELKLHFTKVLQIVERASRFLLDPSLSLTQVAA